MLSTYTKEIVSPDNSPQKIPESKDWAIDLFLKEGLLLDVFTEPTVAEKKKRGRKRKADLAKDIDDILQTKLSGVSM